MAEAPVVISAGMVKERKRHSFMVDLGIRLVKEKPLGTVGGIIVLILLLTAVFADFLAPYGYNEIILADRLSPPSAGHLLGTDNLGRDMLSRIIYGARISLYVGLSATVMSEGIAATIGIVSGYFGGKTDLTIQRFVDAWMSLPNLFILLTIMSLVGPGLLNIILVLGVSGAASVSRVIRSAVLSLKENVYIEATRAIGASDRRVIFRHILPNVMVVIIISTTVRIGAMILMESTLSFLGFGIPPPAPSWGGMLSGAGRQYMLLAPWMAIWPGLALAMTVYGVNMLGDAIRDLLDPRLRGGLGRFGGVEKRRAKRAKEVGVVSKTAA